MVVVKVGGELGDAEGQGSNRFRGSFAWQGRISFGEVLSRGFRDLGPYVHTCICVSGAFP
jgi:hypothetical protein